MAITFNWLPLVIWFLVGLAGGNALGGFILCAISDVQLYQWLLQQ
ncbi:hypothetical protein [Mesoplasma tabanidae]|nr:hypothetical protein [Mesoplasma tabanidae]